MAIKKYTKYISSKHNAVSISCTISNLFIDRITGTNLDGEEELISHNGSFVNGSLAALYSKEYRLINIYYDDASGAITEEIIENDILITTSYSRYGSKGSIELKPISIKSIMKIKPIIEYRNIGDAHLSAVYNITLYDENGSIVHGYEILAPISSDSIVSNAKTKHRLTSKYGFIENKKIEDESLLEASDLIYVFGKPINDDVHIKISNGIISVSDINASSMSFSGTIFVVNTDVAGVSHTPIISNISIVIYEWTLNLKE